MVEERVEAELCCGHHHDLVGELEQLVTEYPLRERLWGQRMVALYRCGRQAESLRAYEELRVLLRDELGIPPSPLVQQLNDAILNQDPVLDLQLPVPRQLTSSATPLDQETLTSEEDSGLNDASGLGGEGEDADPAVVAPWPDPMLTGRSGREHPAGNLDVRFPTRLVLQPLLPFSGRESPYEWLLHACKESAAGGFRVAMVSGEAGIGKTRLTAEVARRAHEMGVVVLFGRCDEDIGMPFQPFVEALSQVLSSNPTRRFAGPPRRRARASDPRTCPCRAWSGAAPAG